MKPSSTQDIVSALHIISKRESFSDDDTIIIAAIVAESALRIEQLVGLTNEMKDHILANPVHHHKCNAKTKGSYCSCLLSRLGSQ